jgi:hypothetical protein
LGGSQLPFVRHPKKKGFGVYFFTPNLDKEVRFVGYAFVDDSDLVQSLEPGKFYQDLIQCMQ